MRLRCAHGFLAHRRPVVALVDGVATPAIEGVVEREPRLELLRDRRHTCATGRARPRAARPPRARVPAGRYRPRARSSPRRFSGAVPRPNSSTIRSKVQRAPRWLQCTSSWSTSNGVAPNRSATSSTSAGATNRNTAMRIDEAPDQPRAGDAVDLGPAAGDPARAPLRVARRQHSPLGPAAVPLSRPALHALLEQLRASSGLAQPRPRRDCPPRRSGRSGWQRHPGRLAAQRVTSRGSRRSAPGMKSPLSRKSMSVGQAGVPFSRASLSGAMALIAGMSVPSQEEDAMLQPVASWGDRNPHAAIRACGGAVKARRQTGLRSSGTAGPETGISPCACNNMRRSWVRAGTEETNDDRSGNRIS